MALLTWQKTKGVNFRAPLSETAPIRRGWGSCLRGGGGFFHGRGGGAFKAAAGVCKQSPPPPGEEGGGGVPCSRGGGASLAKQSIREFVV